MSEKMNYAEKLFCSGLNCSQSVVGVFSEKYGLSQGDVLKLASGLGGGMRNGEVCGAVSGAILVIGMKYGNDKKKCYEKTVEFTNQFKQEHKSIICKELLNCDISTKEGMEKAKNNRLFDTTCIDLVKSSVHILETLGY